MIKLVVGEKYVFTVTGNEKMIRNFGIGSLNAKYDGKIVTVRKVEDHRRMMDGVYVNTQRAWLERSSGFPSYYFPPECFTSIEPIEFKKGGVYVCDKEPDDTRGIEWSKQMGAAIGLPLEFSSFYYGDADTARLDYEVNGFKHRSVYHKSWVRLYHQPVIKKVIKRNVFNFWPGFEKEEK